MRTGPRRRLRFLVPEVVQVSKMDCGPAALKCLLEGFGIHANYNRLREACQTEVDGSSIDTLEEIARGAGIDAEQVMVPVDHVMLPGQHLLPAIVTIRNPSRETHFVILWSAHGAFVQVMDPARGRRWIRRERFLRDLFVGRVRVAAVDWRSWAGSDEFLDPLRRRLLALGVRRARAEELVAAATNDPSWNGLARLDAATRLVAALVESASVAAGSGATRMLEHFVDKARASSGDETLAIPSSFWSVEPAGSRAGDDGPQVVMRGAVLVRTRNARASGKAEADDQSDDDRPRALPPQIAAALEQREATPERALWKLMLEDGSLAPSGVVLGAALAAAGVLVEALLFRALFDVGRELSTAEQRLAACTAFAALLLALLWLELPLVAAMLRLGRHLETRLRAAFQAKVPRLVDAYFRSRPLSDMAERAHSLNNLRALPNLGAQILRTSFAIAFTTAGIVWIDPTLLVPAAACGTAPLVLAALAQPVLGERDLRARNHAGALSRFAIDSLLGLVAIRAHHAERSVRREHEALLVEWARTSASFLRALTLVGGVQTLLGIGFVVWIVAHHQRGGAASPSVLLLLFWAMSLSILGRTLAQLALQYPTLRNVAVRVLEPLSSPALEEHELSQRSVAPGPRARGAHLAYRGVVVRAGGQTILDGIDLEVSPGEHVAIVGTSGAGKSSLVGLLLGWHHVASGRLEVDGAPLDPGKLDELRQETAWIDPAVQLWNRTLLENLQYGARGSRTPLAHVLHVAELQAMLHHLPDGLSTPLGEGGGFLSGGEGQRVRLGRALERSDARLVVMDEPFRALDREQRRRLLERTREHWADATLLHVTHDVEETLCFDRVLVVEDRRIVEDGVPQRLAARPDSRYAALLRANGEVREELLGASTWERLWLERGGLERRDAEPRAARASS